MRKKGRKSICKDNHYRSIVLVKISWQQGECLFVFILKVSFYSLTMANFPITSHVSPFSGPLPLSPFSRGFWSDIDCPSRNFHKFSFYRDTSRIFSDKTITMVPVNKWTRQVEYFPLITDQTFTMIHFKNLPFLAIKDLHRLEKKLEAFLNS